MGSFWETDKPVEGNFWEADPVSGQPSTDSLVEKFRKRSEETGDPAEIGDYLRAKAEAERVDPLMPYDRINHGLGDPFLAGKQLAAHTLPAGIRNTIGMNSPEQIDADIAKRESDYQNARKANGQTGADWWRLGGNMAATAPLMAVLPGATPTSLLGAAGGGIVSGAAGGLLTPVDDAGPGGYARKKFEQTLVGAGGGLLTSVGTYGASKVLNPNPSDEVALLQSKGVTPTMGQLGGGAGKSLEEKLTSVPGLGDAIVVGQGRATRQFNKATYQTAADAIGEKFEGDAGREGLGRLYDMISKAYDKVLPNVAFKADAQFNQDLGTAARAIAFAKPQTQDQFANIVKAEILPRIDANGSMSGEAFKALETELGKQVARWQQAGGDDAALAEGIDGVLDAFRSNLERSNPDHAAGLRAANTAYARYADIRRAVANTRDPDGYFTPNVLWTALKTGDKSAGKHVTAQAEGGDLQELALAGLKVLGNKYPDSGTAGRAAVATLAAGGPAVAGAIASNPLLAIPAGGAALASTAYTLSPVQSAISKLFSRRTGKVAPLLGASTAAMTPLLQAGAVSGSQGLLGP